MTKPANNIIFTKETIDSLTCKTFHAFNDLSIPYTIWKSIDRLSDGTQGKTDLDVLFLPRDKDKVTQLLESQGWVYLVAEAWRTYPDVYDFVIYDKSIRRFIHLHAHFRLIMGKTRVKSLVLPIEELYMETSENVQGIRFASPELEFIVFVHRIAFKVKYTDYIKVVLKGNKKAIYENLYPEYKFIVDRCDSSKIEKLLSRPELSFVDKKLVLSVFEDLMNLTGKKRKKIRKYLAGYLRYSPFTSLIIDNIKRFQQKKQGVGKTLTDKGKSFAFCGPDGAGKTTLVSMVKSTLHDHFKVTLVYMGGSPNSKGLKRTLYRLSVFPLFAAARRIIRWLGMKEIEKKMASRFYSYEETLISQEKIKRLRYAMDCLDKGHIVLFERYPIFEGYGDGGDGILKRRLSGMFEKPDKIFIINISPEIAVNRKQDRFHDPEVVREKAKVFRDFSAGIDKSNSLYHVLDGSDPIENLHADIMNDIAEELRHDH